MMNFRTPRAALMLVFAGFGAAVGCWAGAIPQVMAATGTDSFHLGIGFTLSSLSGVSAMALGGIIGRRFSNRIVMLSVVPVLALNAILLLVATEPWLFFASLIAFGAILGFVDMAMNAEASAIEHDLRRPIFTAFHGSVSIAIALFNEIPLMLASLVLATAGFMTLGLSISFTVNVIAFAAVGFGLAILCPCLFNMAASQVPTNRAAGLSFISLVAGPPRVLAPWAFGWIATNQSTSFAFGLCAVILALAFGLIISLQSLNRGAQLEKPQGA